MLCLLLCVSQEPGCAGRGELRLAAAAGWSLVSVTIVSTCRLLEVASPLQYLCSVEGELVEEMEDIQVFIARLNLPQVTPAGGGQAVRSLLVLILTLF